MSSRQLLEHFFRHEYGRLVAILTQRIGIQYLDDVEDAVQSALAVALDSWTLKTTPNNPSAWLFKVAYNNILGTLRQNHNRNEILKLNFSASQLLWEPEAYQNQEHRSDDEVLKWLFVCCNPSIAMESQLVFALKTLCGFSIDEISMRLFISKSHTYKRFNRASNYLKKNVAQFENINTSFSLKRLDSVHKVLYLLFTEGHFSSHLKAAIRTELCQDAIRLTELLVQHKIGQNPQTRALLALMYLHMARMPSRQDSAYNLMLLEDQDRSQWDQNLINKGLSLLSASATGNSFSRFHAEAGIALEHCLAQSFEQTNWDKIIHYYLLLESITPSIIYKMNRSLAVAQRHSATDGLKVLENIKPDKWINQSYQFWAVKSDLHRRCRHFNKAEIYANKAIDLSPSNTIKQLLIKRLLSDSAS